MSCRFIPDAPPSVWTLSCNLNIHLANLQEDKHELE